MKKYIHKYTYIPRTYVQCFYVSDTGQKISTTTKHPHTLLPVPSITHTIFSTYITFHTISYILSRWMNNKNTTKQLEKVFYPLVVVFLYFYFGVWAEFFHNFPDDTFFIRGFHTFKKRTNIQFFFLCISPHCCCRKAHYKKGTIFPPCGSQ